MLQNAKTQMMKDHGSHWVGALLMLLSMTIFPVADALAKSVEGGLPIVILVWARLFGSALLVTPIILFRDKPIRFRWSETGREALRACIMIGAFGCFVKSFETISFAEAMTYYSIAPVVAAVLAIVFLREHLTWRKGLALGLGFVGVLIAINPQVTPEIGAFFALGTGCLYGLFLMLSRIVATRSDTLTALFLQFWIGSVLLAPFVISTATPQVWDYLPTLSAMAGVSVLSNLLLIQAFRRAETSFLAPFMFIEIISAFAISALFFGEALTVNVLLGAGLVMLAGFSLVSRKRG